MIRSLLKGAATVATLPVYVVGNALMARLLKERLARSEAEVKRLRQEFTEAMDSKVDRQCWTYGAGQQSAVEDVARMLGCKPEIGAVETTIRLILDSRDETEAEAQRLRQERDEMAREGQANEDWLMGICNDLTAQRDHARRWSALWHERAREYRYRWRYMKDRCAALDHCMQQQQANGERYIHQVRDWLGADDNDSTEETIKKLRAEHYTLKARLAEVERVADEWKTEATERKAEAERWYQQSAEHGRRYAALRDAVSGALTLPPETGHRANAMANILRPAFKAGQERRSGVH